MILGLSRSRKRLLLVYTRHKFRPSSSFADKNLSNDRYNELGIQMIPKSLHEKLFPDVASSDSRLRQPEYKKQVQLAKEYLETINVSKFDNMTVTKPELLDFKLPKLLGKNIEEHFYILGLSQSQKPCNLARRLVGAPIPPMPKRWSRAPGWTRYDPYTGECLAVPAPDQEIMVFDVENVATESQFPALATAVSEKYWFSWVSPQLFTESTPFRELISIGDVSKPHVVIGHNVGYDRARVKEEYLFEGTANQWIDTLSLHSAVGGLSSQQRTFWMKYKKVIREVEEECGDQETLLQDANVKKWLEVSSMSSLADIVELYCNEKLSKSDRDVFFKGTRRDVQERFDQLMFYCANDVAYTLKAFKKLFPKFLRKCPHPASFSGMLQMGKGYLTTTSSWVDYIDRCDSIYRKNSETIEKHLLQLADRALKMLDNKLYEKDPWLSRLDWSCPAVRYTSAKYKKDGSYAKNGEPRLVARQGPLKGYPQWYRELYDSKSQRVKVTQRSRVTPYLLKLAWRGFPLYHTKSMGWTYVVPRSQKPPDELAKPLAFSTDPRDPNFDDVAAADRNSFYYKVPHKDGEDANCGDPLGKSYMTSFTDGLLRSEYPEAQQIVALNIESSYWMSSRQRVRDQFVVWQEVGRELGIPSFPNSKMGVILPQSKVMGTITRRAVEPTWMTASNAKKDRLGSELKSQVLAPPGYVILGADVDSQELWISSLLGDGQFQLHGGTPFGWMNLQGSKSEGTDLHSNTANIIGISRDNAKVFNYSRIYGAGGKHAVQLLLQFKPSLSNAEAQERATKLYKQTKGQKLKGRLNGYPSGFWFGGTESHMFNQLEKIAMSQDPRTPVLSCGIPEGLTPQNAGNEFLTSRINWVVQSSGVDYLHLLLVSMQYLIEKFDIDAQYLISIHDEIRFRVKKEDADRAALALQVANLWTRAIFSQRCCVPDLPVSIAFFSAVDIDFCLRKEVDMDCLTPSNKVALAPGRRMSIFQSIEVMKGTLGSSDCYRNEPEGVKRALEYLENFNFNLPKAVMAQPEENHLKWLRLQCARDENQILSMATNEASTNRGQLNEMRQRAVKRELYSNSVQVPKRSSGSFPRAGPSRQAVDSAPSRDPNFNPLRHWSNGASSKPPHTNVQSISSFQGKFHARKVPALRPKT